MPTVFLWNPIRASGDFNTATNWISVAPTGVVGPPGADDIAIFATPADVTVNGTNTDVINVALGGQTFSIGGSLTTGAFVFVGPAPMTVAAGGLFHVTGILAAASTETITISGSGAGGTVDLGNEGTGSGASNIIFDFANTDPTTLNTGVIQFDAVGGSHTTNQVITDVALGDEFVIGGQSFVGDTVNYSGTTLTVVDGGALDPGSSGLGSVVMTMNNVSFEAGAVNAFHINDTNIIEAGPVCYARGTMIRTPDGELPVEKLRPGKRVIALIEGQEVPQTVTWLGHRRIDLTSHPRPETVAPIRIQRDAFADDMPHRDLVVSPDHAIFVDGKLIGARQLVNGTTIRQEPDWTAVDYYHVELDQHAILLAEGLPAESYIDTGNSGFFANSGAPMVLHPDLTDETNYPTREAGSCAPFVWDEASVQPVWQRLADRAAAIGRPVPQHATTADAALRVFTKRPTPRTLKPIYSDSNLVIFVLPSRSAEVQLLSRAQSPTEARPWLEDRRRLGVRVKRIVLRGANEVREIPVDHPDLSRGWWAVERDGQVMSRWTDGDAVLPLPAMRWRGHAGNPSGRLDDLRRGRRA